jgi:putative phage-type endonuclease
MPRLTEAELSTRRSGLGSTDVVEILGLAPWEGAGPMRVYVDKTSTGPVEEESDPEKRASFEWGHELEGVIASWYERKTSRKLLLGGHVPHRTIPWLFATLDRKAEDRIVEIKNVSGFMARHWDPSREDGVPRYVRAQCIVGQACLGTRLTDVVASLGGRPPHSWTVAWDEALWDVIRITSEKFWRRVEARDPPALDSSDATREMLRRLFPTNEDRVIVPASEAAERLAEQRISYARMAREAADDVRLIDADLLRLIGTHDGIEGDGWKMTWKVDKNGTRRSRFTSASASNEE